ncbi:Uncharacterised protein g6507 [Pycnogonum litorale]
MEGKSKCFIIVDNSVTPSTTTTKVCNFFQAKYCGVICSHQQSFQQTITTQIRDCVNVRCENRRAVLFPPFLRL